ncbi:MAG: N-6 DNA methylase [Spirochaetaceae bacterium]|jgi:type I restriction enzyme M protein|nr:N-6 DNA methylase [Spirochaetaceae bacterium]
MLDADTKRKIDAARDILVGKVPDPKSQVEQITIALIYKFMDDMDRESISMGGRAGFFTGAYKRYGWSKIFDPRVGGLEMLALYSEAISKLDQNPAIPQLFRDIFKNAYLPYRDPETLKLFLKTINEFSYDHSEKLGDAFEYLLSVLGSQGDAGQFRTPRHIIDFMVEAVDPKKQETIVDPACGTAGFLVSSYKHIIRANTAKQSGDQLSPAERQKLFGNFKGYDISPDMVRLSLVNLYLHGFVRPKIYEYDTLTSEERWNEYADVILANPPFMSPKGGIIPHKRFSVQSKRSEVLFVDYIAEHLTPTGRAAVIVPEGIIFQSAKAYTQLRKMLVEKYLYAVVSLPAGVFNPYSGVKTSILFMNRQIAAKTSGLLFIKVENDGFDLGAQRRKIEKNDLPMALKAIKEFQKTIINRKVEEVEKVNKGNTAANILIVPKETLAENGEYNLTGERYRVSERRGKQKWPMVRLGDVCEFISKGTTPTTVGYKFQPEGINFIKIESINENGYFIKNKFTYINAECNNQLKRSMLHEEDVLFSIAGAFGRIAVVTKDVLPANTNQALSIIRPIRENLNSYYLASILRSTMISNEINILKVGVAQYNISLSQVCNLQIPLPPLEIQQEIVAEIEGYQKVIDGARQVVDNWKPRIEVDPEWPMVKLGDVCEFNPKKSEISSLEKDTIVSFLPMDDIGTMQDIYPQKERPISEVYKGYSYFQDNDVLIAKVTPCFENGKSGIARKLKTRIGFGSTEIHVIRPSEKILPEYIYPYISSKSFLTNGKTKMTGTGGLQRLPIQFIFEFEIPLPPLAIQQEIVAGIETERKIIDGCRELIVKYEEKIKKVVDGVWND